MSLQSVPLLSLDFFPSRPVHVEISDAPLSSDAGLLPIRQFDEQIRLTEQFAAAIEDRRDPIFTQQPLLSMVRQRIYGILADYEDQNDHDTLRSDPMLPSGDPGSPALSMMCLRIQGITWLDSSNWVLLLEFGLVSLDLLNAPAGIRLDDSLLDDESLTVVLATTASSSACPLCDFDSSRVHSRYTRRFADLPCFGKSRPTARHGPPVLLLGASMPTPHLRRAPTRVCRAVCSHNDRSFARPTRRLAVPSAASPALGSPSAWPVATSPDTLLRRVKQLQD